MAWRVLPRRIEELTEQGEKAFPGKGHTQEEELRRLEPENQPLKETVGIPEPMLHPEQLQKSSGYRTSNQDLIWGRINGSQADPT